MRTFTKDELPLVSICIAAYNAERFIAETLESALAQDYLHLEIVVSDDGSTDGTAEILQGYEPKGVRLLRQKKNLGIHGNYNAAFRASTGKYVCNLDHDDLLEPDYVSTLVQAMESNSQITFAHCACRLIDAEGNFLGYERSINGSFIRSGLDEWPRYVFGPRAVNRVMIRRSAFEAAGGYDERFAVSGDWKMHRDLLKLGDVFYCDKVLATFRSHSVGKNGRRLLLAKDVLLHLQDMEQCWPLEVPGKAKLLLRARRRQAMGLVLAAADAAHGCDPRFGDEFSEMMAPEETSLSGQVEAFLIWVEQEAVDIVIPNCEANIIAAVPHLPSRVRYLTICHTVVRSACLTSTLHPDRLSQVVAINQLQMKELPQRWGVTQERVQLIPHGIDNEPFDQRQGFGFENRNFGRFFPSKTSQKPFLD